jgi:hypothetical protein
LSGRDQVSVELIIRPKRREGRSTMDVRLCFRVEVVVMSMGGVMGDVGDDEVRARRERPRRTL